jgi:hypothetical protein
MGKYVSKLKDYCIVCIDKWSAKEAGPNVPKRWDYKEAQKRFRPLDMVACRGDGLISDAIAESQRAKLGEGRWSHVGLLVNTDIMPGIINGQKGKWYIWESTSLNEAPDVESKKAVTGVQVRDFEQVCKEYYGFMDTEVAVYRLKDNPWQRVQDESDESYAVRQESLRIKLSKAHQKYHGRPYDFSGALAGFFKCLRKYRDNNFVVNKFHDYAMFCSELVASVYVDIGLLPESVDPENVVPEDFFGFDADKEMPLVFEPAGTTVIQTGMLVIKS